MARFASLVSVAAIAVAGLACGSSVEFQELDGGNAGSAAQAANGTGNTGAVGAAGTGGTGNWAGTGGTGNWAGTGGTGNWAGTGGTGNWAGTGGVGNWAGTGGVAGTGGGTGGCYPLAQCGPFCVDTNFDPEHCGGCFQPCDEGAECIWGQCQCPDGICGFCSWVDLGSATPQTISGSTWGYDDHLTPPCAAPGSPDVAYIFSPAVEGEYRFDTAGSGYDTALVVLDAVTCSMLACNDDYQDLSSRVDTALGEGQSVLVVVDGFGGAGGPFTLHLSQASSPLPCPVVDLGDAVPAVASGDTSYQTNAAQGSCGGGQAPELSYRFTAPVPGMYSFTTVGSSYDTLLYVRRDSCQGPELACNDDSIGTASRVDVPLEAGQSVVVFVDGFGNSSGPFVLRIQPY